jgi:DNA primase
LFEDPAKATDAIRELVKTLALVNDELKRNLLMKTISKKFNLREKLIESELNTFLQLNSRNAVNASKQLPRDIRVTENLSAMNVAKTENPIEKELIRLLFSGKEEIVEYILEKIGIEEFTDMNMKSLAEVVSVGFNEHKISPAYLIDQIPNEDLKSFVFKLALTDETISKKWDEFSYNGKIEKDTFLHAEETVKNFLVHKVEQEINANIRIIAESKDERLYLELLKRNKELQDDKKVLQNSKTN